MRAVVVAVVAVVMVVVVVPGVVVMVVVAAVVGVVPVVLVVVVAVVGVVVVVAAVAVVTVVVVRNRSRVNINLFARQTGSQRRIHAVVVVSDSRVFERAEACGIAIDADVGRRSRSDQSGRCCGGVRHRQLRRRTTLHTSVLGDVTRTTQIVVPQSWRQIHT